MNLTDLKDSLIVPATSMQFKHNGQMHKYNLYKSVNMDKARDFVDMVINEVFMRGEGYRPEMVEYALDYATIATFTDIEFGSATRDDIYAFCHTTSIMSDICGQLDTCCTNQLYHLRRGARDMIEYYRQLTMPASVAEEVLQTFNGLIGDARELVNKMADFNIESVDTGLLADLTNALSSIKEEDLTNTVLN